MNRNLQAQNNILLQWNVNGIRTRKDEINNIILDHDPIILCLSETLLTSNIPYICPGYNCFRKDREPPDSGGGLITLVKKNIGAKIINVINNFDRENLIVEIVTDNKVITILSFYDNNGQGNKKNLEILLILYLAPKSL